jgi:hypothetical protein
MKVPKAPGPFPGKCLSRFELEMALRESVELPWRHQAMIDQLVRELRHTRRLRNYWWSQYQALWKETRGKA